MLCKLLYSVNRMVITSTEATSPSHRMLTEALKPKKNVNHWISHLHQGQTVSLHEAESSLKAKAAKKKNVAEHICMVEG